MKMMMKKKILTVAMMLISFDSRALRINSARQQLQVMQPAPPHFDILFTNTLSGHVQQRVGCAVIQTPPVRTRASSSPPKRCLRNQYISCAACVRLCLTTVNELGTVRFMKLSFLLPLFSCFYLFALCGGRVASPQIIETFRAHTLVYDASQTKRRQNARHSCCCCF